MSAPEPQEGPTVTVSSKHTERLKDLRQFIIGWRELDWPEGFDRFTAQTIADEVEKRFPKNDAPDPVPAPLPAPDRVGIWACHTNSNGSVWVVPVEGAKPVQLRSDFDEGIERWYWLSEPDTQEQSK